MDSGIRTAVILGVSIAVAIAGISTGLSFLEIPQFDSVQNVEEQGNMQTTSIDKSNFKLAPDLVGIAEYINTTPEELAKEMEGKVILYDIWTYSCINCIRTLPYITTWNDKYGDNGLLVVGIHSPEFEFEKDVENVKMAVDKHGITYPVVMDNEWETWKAFENRYWPRKYVADHEGYIRYDHIGEGGYEQTEKIIQRLLEERANAFGINMASAESLVDIEEFKHTAFRTPELYFGYKFAQGRNQLGNSEGFQPEKEVKYVAPENLKQHYFYLDGIWKNLEGSMRLISDKGAIKLLYHAKEVNIVTKNDATLEIFLDGEPISKKYSGIDVTSGIVKTDEARLYNLVNSEQASTHVLEISISNPGFEVYTFTFG